MALYALFYEELIFASDAVQKEGYLCIECRGPLKLRREGRRYQAYFYHEKISPLCRLHGKSERHETVQRALQILNPSLEIEKPFPSIGRIADLYSEKEKCVYEVQCSRIREEEVDRRAMDYQLLGIDVIWLLDDRCFNKKYISPAEGKMRDQGGYFFTLVSEELFPRLYDQNEYCFGGRRLSKTKPLWVEFTALRKRSGVMLEKQQLQSSISRLSRVWQFLDWIFVKI